MTGSVCQSFRGRRRREAGAALIMVVGVLAVAGLMAAHVAVLSEVTAREAAVAAARSELRYAAESAADRAFWLLLADRAWFTNRRLGTNVMERDEFGEESWMADGKSHAFQIGDAAVTVAILDADAGLDVSGAAPGARLRAMLLDEDGEAQAEVDRFLDVLNDYVDRDDVLSLNGKERPEYEGDGFPVLPRNGPLQFREELFWLDGLVEGLAAGGISVRAGYAACQVLRVIPPTGFAFTAASRGRRGAAAAASRPSFFSSSPSLIQQVCGLSESELEEVLRARDLWQTEGVALEESLDPTLLSRLQGNFSFDESGIAVLWVTARTRDGETARTLRLTRDCRPAAGAYAGPPQRGMFAYWDRVLF